MAAGGVQFLYCLLVGTFPFNSFLSGFISCVGSFVLAVALRIQTNPANAAEFAAPGCSPPGLGLGVAAGASVPGSLGVLQGRVAGEGALGGILPERAFVDFLFAHLILHLAVLNFIG